MNTTISYATFSEFLSAVRLNTPKRKKVEVHLQPLYHHDGRSASAHIALTANGDDCTRAIIFRVGDTTAPANLPNGNFGTFDELKVQTTLALDILNSELEAAACDHTPGLIEFPRHSGLLGDPSELWVLDDDGVKRATE